MIKQINIGIIGTGLIGGSLAASLCGKDFSSKNSSSKNNYQLFCYNRREQVSKQALKLGVVDGYFTSISQLTKNSDVIIIATPLNTYGEIALQIAAETSENSVDEKVSPNKINSSKISLSKIISDVGSVKFLPSAEVLNNLPANLQSNFVPAHPIAGSEKTGIDAADANLFIGKKLIITKLLQTDEHKANIIAQIWADAGAEVTYLDAKTHDEIYAKVSHLPQLLSFIYKKTFAVLPFEIEQIGIEQSHNYAEFTRLGNSDENLWADIFKYNNAQILDCLNLYKNALINNSSNNKTLENIPQILAQSLADIIAQPHKQFGGTGLKSFLTPINSQFQSQQKSVINNFITEFLKQIEAYEKSAK